MKIAVCVKRVPDMDVRFRIGADNVSVDEAGLKFDLNDFDAWAVEAALQLKDKNAGSEVVVSRWARCRTGDHPEGAQHGRGPRNSSQGRQGSVRRTSRSPRRSPRSSRTGGYDLILFGKMSPDSSNGVVGPIVAELLGLPCVTAISRLEIANGKGTAKRELEGAQEIVEFPLPAVLTVDEGLNTARSRRSKESWRPRRSRLKSSPRKLGEPQVTVRKLELPAERAAGRIVGEGAAAVPELVRLLQTEAKVL